MASRPNITKGAARLNRLIDLNAYPIQPVLRILLRDRTTGENIIWATNNYEKLGNTYHSAATMRLKDLVKLDKSVIQPRVYKTLELQKQRTKVNAEVFTPSWICCLMNNHLDDIWFGRKDVFNKMKDKSWRATNRPIEFPASGSKTWQGYVDSRRIEITCGEAPYLVSRYDTTTGKVIPISHRIGVLDRKLRVVNENAENEAEWIKWTLRAYQATYGYEYQGDNLLIARINMLMTFVDYMQARWERNPTEDELKAVAFIISWNVWQMNGLTYKTSYDADADRKRLQKIIDECDELIRLYDERINPSVEDGACSVEEAQIIDSMLESKKNELTMEDLIEIVKQEDLYDLAYLYADYHGIRIIDGDVPDYSAELDKLRQEMVEDKKDVQCLRDETYAEKCMIADAPDCLIKNWRMRRTEYFRDIAQKKGKGIMKFDYCIGNPPYQQETENVSETNGQKRSKSVFHHFQEAADKIAKDGSVLIYPGARWIQRSGKGMVDFGLKQINDKHLQQLYFYPNSGDIFNGVAIGDGVSIVVKNMCKDSNEFEYIYIEKNKSTTVTIHSPGENIIPLNPNDILIVNKIETFINDNNLTPLHNRVHPQKLFAIESDFIEKNQSVARLLRNETDFNEKSEVKLYANDKAGKAGRTTWFIVPKTTITTATDYIAKWKVVVSSANAGGQKRDNQLEIIDNKSAFGRSRVALASFDTKVEAENFYKYVNSNIIKFAFLMTDEALTTLALKVPDVNNYTNGGLINFEQDIDIQLATLMKLTDEEVQYINDVIKNLRNKKEVN